MALGRTKLYSLLTLALVAGYIWLFWSFNSNGHAASSAGVCIIKQVTDIPCPSCGSTRSVLSILHGDFWGGLYWNPLGAVVLSIMLITPLWMAADLSLNTDSLLQFYRKTEAFFQQPKYAIPAIILVVMNWIWNIMKGL